MDVRKHDSPHGKLKPEVEQLLDSSLPDPQQVSFFSLPKLGSNFKDQMYVLHLDSEAGEIIGFVSVNERRPDLPPVLSLHPKSPGSLYVALTLKQRGVGIKRKPEYQNQGYKTEAATVLLHYLT